MKGLIFISLLRKIKQNSTTKDKLSQITKLFQAKKLFNIRKDLRVCKQNLNRENRLTLTFIMKVLGI